MRFLEYLDKVSQEEYKKSFDELSHPKKREVLKKVKENPPKSLLNGTSKEYALYAAFLLGDKNTFEQIKSEMDNLDLFIQNLEQQFNEPFYKKLNIFKEGFRL